jgi:hypothetical protein
MLHDFEATFAATRFQPEPAGFSRLQGAIARKCTTKLSPELVHVQQVPAIQFAALRLSHLCHNSGLDGARGRDVIVFGRP